MDTKEMTQTGVNGQTTSGRTGSSDRESHGVNVKNLKRMLEMQQYKCALTGWDLTPKTATVDHIHPLSQDGTHTIDNVHIVHTMANRAKGTLSLEQFVQLCRAVAAMRPGPS